VKLRISARWAIYRSWRFFHLVDNEISDISPLANLQNLKILHLGNNEMPDVSLLSNLYNLKEIVISNNNITDVSLRAKRVSKKLLRICYLHRLQSHI